MKAVGQVVQTTASDEELLLRVQQGEHAALDLLVRRYERELYGYLCRYLNDEELAEDVFQNTFLQVFLKIEQYEAGRAARPWLYAIATNQAIDALRRQQRRRDRASLQEERSHGDDETSLAAWEWLAAEPTTGPLDKLERAEQCALIRQAVAQLPELLRSVVLLIYFQGLKYHEAAEVLGIPLGTVKSRLHAALKKLVPLCAAWEQESTPAQECLPTPWALSLSGGVPHLLQEQL
ncbi:MAG: sigma-70 family RNA polymerase sigma factor [Gemmataceae bacterium]|nr:sigma-70 family RNA polymerase sigma factor [Gemmataceae bacterium]MDW8244301.1 sigma-70 family RNA polymerase sigma factor [Thermogemmata sp.]